jgi:hypothetical protein
MWGALSDERMGMSFTYIAGPCQRSVSRVLVPWDLRPYFTDSQLRLPYSSPPTTRRVTVEVFDPASTRGCPIPLEFTLKLFTPACLESSLYSLGADTTENTASNNPLIVVMGGCLAIARILLTCLPAVTKQRMLYSCLATVLQVTRLSYI